MLQDHVRVDDLFPAAKELFDRISGRRKATSWLAWTLVVGLAFILGRKALRWIDRNL